MYHTHDPCPWVTSMVDFGGAFAMGAIGGTIWHGIKGYRNSPYGKRRISAISTIKMHAPVLSSNFSVWGGLFSTFNYAITAGFFTRGALAICGGYKAAQNSAISCALLLAVIKGVSISFQKIFARSMKLEIPQPLPLNKKALAQTN